MNKSLPILATILLLILISTAEAADCTKCCGTLINGDVYALPVSYKEALVPNIVTCTNDPTCGVTTTFEGTFCWYGCTAGECNAAPNPCTDPDGGANANDASTVTYWSGSAYVTIADVCNSPTQVKEAICENNVGTTTNIDCPLGNTCINGHCGTASPCTDPDGGANANDASTVTYWSGSAYVTIADVCNSPTQVKEAICENNVGTTTNIDCPLGLDCVSGHCGNSNCPSGVTTCGQYTKAQCPNNPCNIPGGCSWYEDTMGYGISECMAGAATGGCTTPCSVPDVCKEDPPGTWKCVPPGGSTPTTSTMPTSDIVNQIKLAVKDIACLVYCLLITIFAGIAALALILAGLTYMTSEDPSDRSEARRRMMYIIVGVIIAVLACPIITMLFSGTVIDVGGVGPCTCDCGKYLTGGSSTGPGGSGGGGNTPVVTTSCNTCSGGQACNSFVNLKNCECTGTFSNGKWAKCSLATYCNKCTDGTGCSATNSGTGKTCTCSSAGPQSGTYKTCSLTGGSSSSVTSNCNTCSGGQACNSFANLKACDCTGTFSNGKWTTCTQTTYCNKCTDGTGCSATNSGTGKTCTCSSAGPQSGTYKTCSLSGGSTTGCSSTKTCSDSVNYYCKFTSFSESSPDNTCTRKKNNGETCTSWEIVGGDKHMVCVSGNCNSEGKCAP